MKFSHRSLTLTALLTVTTLASSAWAVPYASGVRNTSGSMYEFVLNEPADIVTIHRDDGNEISINAARAGRHMFDLEEFSSFEIEVEKNAPAGWTEISDPENRFTNFERPSGLAINTDPSSPYFGTVYVANTRDAATASERPMAPGLYALTADLVGVDFANNFGIVADPDDTSFFKAPGFSVTGSETSSPNRITLDDGGNVIVGDWSDPAGGVKYASPDLSSGGLVLATEGGPDGGVDSSVSDEFGVIPLHGSINSEPHVTGTVGEDLTLWAMDEDVDSSFSLPIDDRNSIWRWDVGAATNYDIPPTLVIDSNALGDGWLLNNSALFVRGDAHYSAVHDKWYLTQYRSDGTNQPGLLVVSADGVDGRSPTVEFRSLDFSMEKGLDGLPDVEGNPATDGLQDIFREIGTVEVSPDGTKLYVHRHAVSGGMFSNTPVNTLAPGAVLIIPLDENGLPIIELNDNGTPEDTLDDYVENWDSISVANNGSSHTVGAEAEFDAAGNIYTTTNNAELLQAWSPGGNTRAITTSVGGFTVETIDTPVLAGDYNGDGAVDASDYVVWRDSLGASVTPGEGADGNNDGVINNVDYAIWVDNYGTNLAPGAATAPEPTSGLLALVALSVGAATCGARRRVGVR